MKAVTLVPEHHGDRLIEAHGCAALARIAQPGRPVVLTQPLEDRRRRRAWDRAEDLNVNARVEAASAAPGRRAALNNGVGFDGKRLREAGLKGRCRIDFARKQAVFRKEVPQLIGELDVAAIACGAHAPFDYAGPSLVTLAHPERLPAAEFERSGWRKAAAFFGSEA